MTQLSQCPSTLSISPPKGSPCKTLPLVTEIEPKVERIAQKLNQKFNHELNELHTLMNVCSFYSALISISINDDEDDDADDDDNYDK